MKEKLYFFIFAIFNCIITCYAWTIMGYIESFLNIERCNNNWIINDIEGLKNVFNEKVFGQPFLNSALLPLLKAHLEEGSTPKKSLTISFHGSTGTGKTYVSQLIADYIFFKGRNSEFYKHYTMADINSYSKVELINDIKYTVRKCSRSIIVFDEIEKFPDGMLEVINSFLDNYSSVAGIDFRKSTFIFISNIGTGDVNSLSKKFWDTGLDRTNYRIFDFEQVLLENAFNVNGGLKGTRVVKNYLVDLYLPFLPLEEKHVIECIKKIQIDISDEIIKEIIEEIIFVPSDGPIFSMSGCKGIESKVRLTSQRNHRNHREKVEF